MQMEKLDLSKKHKAYYTAKTNPEIVTIEKAQFLSITGKGDPEEKAFAERVEALYATAYTIKFQLKAQGQDFVVAKLEGLWWFDEQKRAGLSMVESATQVPRSEWEYRLLIRMPEFVDKKAVEESIKSVIERKGILLANELELFEMEEGKSVQMLHVGPFSEEPKTLALMLQFMEKNRLGKNGLHHEIYLSDFRKTAPAKLKTILREPVV